MKHKTVMFCRRPVIMQPSLTLPTTKIHISLEWCELEVLSDVFLVPSVILVDSGTLISLVTLVIFGNFGGLPKFIYKILINFVFRTKTVCLQIIASRYSKAFCQQYVWQCHIIYLLTILVQSLVWNAPKKMIDLAYN